ncbi:MAG: nucleotidyltransferase family protein [Gammaproteobacteria bacterium]
MDFDGLITDLPRPFARRRESGIVSDVAPCVGAVVLAAGLSSRMAPASKLLMNLGDRPLIRHVVQTAIDTGLNPVTVVVGHDGDAIRVAVEGLPVRIVDNDDYREGVASSIRAGVRAIAAEVDAAVFLLGDMPLVAPRHLRLLLAAFAADPDRGICIPTYRSKRGNPVLWSARHFPHLLALCGDQGARVLFHEFDEQIVEVEMPDDGVLIDIDTRATLETVLSRLTGREATQDVH